MPTNTIEKPQEIYQIKVTLTGTDPLIWRRLLVPSNLTLEQLHDVLQLAMGWEDCHMHEFRIGQQRFGKPDPMEQAFAGPRAASERTARCSACWAGREPRQCTPTTSAIAGSPKSLSRNAWCLNQGAPTPHAWRGNGTAHPRTVAASLAFTTFWRRSAIRSMSSIKNCWIGLATVSIQKRSRSKRLTGDSRRCNGVWLKLPPERSEPGLFPQK